MIHISPWDPAIPPSRNKYLSADLNMVIKCRYLPHFKGSLYATLLL